MKNLKVIIACGSGAVTSTMCAEIVRNLAKDNGITANVTTCSAMEFAPQIKNYDVKFTTMPYKFDASEKHTMNIFPLITGINAAACKEKIVEILKEAAEE